MFSLPQCPICSFPADGRNSNDFSHVHNCIRCGKFEVTDTAATILLNMFGSINLDQSPIAASLAHWIRDQQSFGITPKVTSEVIEKHTAAPHFPDIGTQLSNLLRLVGDTIKEPGPNRGFDGDEIQFQVGCRTRQGISGLVHHLIDKRWVSLQKSGQLESHGSFIGTLTVAGWLEYENILKDKNVGRKAFIAMPFNKPDLDDEWLPKLRLAVQQTGYELERVDDNPKPGLIDTRMKLQIKAARFLLVELTHGNSGAYWEAGMAEGLGKSVIYLRRDDNGSKAHFDVEHSLRIEWGAENMEPALETLKATIRNSMPDALMYDEV